MRDVRREGLDGKHASYGLGYTCCAVRQRIARGLCACSRPHESLARERAERSSGLHLDRE
jgi:hypothetical protein